MSRIVLESGWLAIFVKLLPGGYFLALLISGRFFVLELVRIIAVLLLVIWLTFFFLLIVTELFLLTTFLFGFFYSFFVVFRLRYFCLPLMVVILIAFLFGSFCSFFVVFWLGYFCLPLMVAHEGRGTRLWRWCHKVFTHKHRRRHRVEVCVGRVQL